jgi:hypothetical protein
MDLIWLARSLTRMKRFHVWETFHTLGAIPIYGGGTEIAPKTGAGCVPSEAAAAKGGACREPQAAHATAAC